MLMLQTELKETIKANLPSLTETELNRYNSSKYVLLAPGESKVLKIASWVEYDEVSTALAQGESLTFATRIYMTATQDKDGVIG